MGYWGVKSYENDEAADVLDAAFEQVHGDAYDALMDDRNPLPFDEVQRRLADARTLEAAVAMLVGKHVANLDGLDDESRLAFVGIMVQHAEAAVPIPEPWRLLALKWLDEETLDWDEPTARRLRRDAERRRLASATQSPTRHVEGSESRRGNHSPGDQANHDQATHDDARSQHGRQSP